MRDPNATQPDEWIGGRTVGQIILLPSGNRARCRRTFSLLDAMQAGTLPNPLSKLIDDMLAMGATPEPETPDQAKVAEQAAMKQFMEMDKEDQLSLFELIDAECYKIFLSPTLLPVPPGEDPRNWSPEGEGELSIHDVSWEDRIYAYNWAQGAPMDIAKFRQTNEAMAVVANEFAVSRQAQHAG